MDILERLKINYNISDNEDESIKINKVQNKKDIKVEHNKII